MRSRVVTGFHRLGIVLAVPLLLAGAGVAISAFLSEDGPYVPDPMATLEMAVILVTERQTSMTDDLTRIKRNVKRMLDQGASEQEVDAYVTGEGVTTDDIRDVPRPPSVNPAHSPRDLLAEPPARIQVDSGPIRTFAFYRADSAPAGGKIDADFEAVIRSLTSFERQRGSVLLAAEQPVQIGDFLVQEAEADRSQTYRSWKHLRRGFDMERLGWAGVLAAAALVLYLVARALGWIIDGFVTPRGGN